MPASTPIEREVGRLTGILEQVAESLKETKQVVQALQEDVQQNTVMTTQLTDHFATVDEKLTKVESQMEDLMTMRSKLGGAFIVLLFFMGIFVKFSSSFASLWNALLSLFRH